MSVLVDHSAETVVSAYGEAFDPVDLERVGQLPEGCCRGEGAVGAVQVVVPLVLVKRVPEVGLVPDQRAVQQFGAKRLHPSVP
jgi:hypothetical protein